jgi:hypothetical protein
MQPSPTNVSPSRPIEASSAHPSLSASSKRLVPWLIAVAFFMESLDTTILNTAVPTIAAALQVAPLSMKSVLASYTLSLAAFIPISGWMADQFGTRRVFASAIGIFTLGRFVIARHSPEKFLETGLQIKALEKNRRNGSDVVRRPFSLVRFVEEIPRKAGLFAYFSSNAAIARCG